MDAGKEDSASTAAEKSSRKNGKAPKETRNKERESEAITVTSNDAFKKRKKAASKKRLAAASPNKGPSSAAEQSLPGTTAAEHTPVATTAAKGDRQFGTTQGTQASKATRAKRRDKGGGGGKRKGQGVVSSSQEPVLLPSVVGGPSLQPNVGDSQKVRVTPPEGQAVQSPGSADSKHPDATHTVRQAADRRKSSAAALSLLISEAELSGDLPGEVLGQGPVAVSIIPATGAPHGPDSELVSPSSKTPGAGNEDITEAKTSVVFSDKTSIRTSKSAISEQTDIAARSERRRSTLLKQHSAISERALRDRRGSTMPEKSGLRNKSCILGCVAAVVSGTLLLVLALYRVPGILKTTVCDTPACVQFSRRMQESLNTSVEPCQDFAHFVCGGWGKTHDLTVAEEAFIQALHSVGHRLSEVEVPVTEKQDTKLKAHLLYRSCYSVLKGERDELDNVRKALLEVGVVWPHTSSQPNVLSTVLRSSLALHWGAPFDVTLRQEATGALVVHLEPFRMFGLIRDKFRKVSGDEQGRKAYFETLKSSLKASDKGLLDFETVNGLDEDAFSSLPQKVEASPDPVTLDENRVFEGVENVSVELWREALSPYAPVKNIRHIAVRTRSSEFVIKFRDLWARYGWQKTHIFVSWFIVQIAALYANQKLQLNFYGSEDRAVLIQGSSCLARAFLIAPSHAFAGYDDELLESRSRFLAYRLMLTIRHAFERRLRRWKGFDANVTVLQKNIGTEGVLHVLQAGFVPEGEDTTADMQDSLVHNWRNAPVPTTEPGRLRDVHTAIEAGQLLVLQEQDFVLMPYAFALPYFNEGFTAALNYAGVGGIASFAMANLFYEAYSEPTGGNSSLQDALDCMTNFSADAQDEAVAKVLTLRVLGTQSSFEAYERHTSSYDMPLTRFESYSPEMMFFIASCYRLCEGGGQSAASSQCNEYLQHVDKFAHAFGCAQSSPMNPPVKCSLS